VTSSMFFKIKTFLNFSIRLFERTWTLICHSASKMYSKTIYEKYNLQSAEKYNEIVPFSFSVRLETSSGLLSFKTEINLVNVTKS